MTQEPDSSPLLDYAGMAFPVEGLGPGARRVVIWVRGCPARCAGCISPELWTPGSPTPVAAVAEELLPFLAEADGLTISGGEPFLQAAALAALIDRLREARADLEVLVYSGFLLEELTARGGEAVALLARIDLLIDGPFRVDAANTLRWRGSDNQRVHLLTARAQRYAEEGRRPIEEPRPLQVQMLGPGRVRIVGIPRRGDMAAFSALMTERGWEVVQDHG